MTQTRESATVVPPAVTEAPSESVATVTETRPAEVVTETRPGQIVTETRPPEVVTVTQPATKITTVGVTVTSAVIQPVQTTAAEPADEAGGTSPWVWVLVAAGAALVIALVVWLLRRGSKDKALAKQQRLVAATVSGWTAQGWAIESQTESSAVLHRNGERLEVSIEPDGRISSRRVGAPSEPTGWESGAGAGRSPDEL